MTRSVQRSADPTPTMSGSSHSAPRVPLSPPPWLLASTAPFSSARRRSMPPSRSFVIRWPGPRAVAPGPSPPSLPTFSVGRRSAAQPAPRQNSPLSCPTTLTQSSETTSLPPPTPPASPMSLSCPRHSPSFEAPMSRKGSDSLRAQLALAWSTRRHPSSPEKTSARLSNPTIHLRRRLPTTPAQCRYSTNPPRLNSRRSGWLRSRSPPRHRTVLRLRRPLRQRW